MSERSSEEANTPAPHPKGSTGDSTGNPAGDPSGSPSSDRASSRTRVAVVLSAGYFGFFAHAGFMLAVEELGLDYHAIAGSSAGAIVAALHGSGVPAAEIVEVLSSLRRKDFWDSDGVRGILAAIARRGRGWTGLLRGDLFESLIERHLRVKTFAECPRSVYITAFNLTRGIDETFRAGTIADKVRASCSYPFLMAPKVIDGQHYWDGGFLAKIPLETMLEAERPDRVLIHYLPAREEQVKFDERRWSAFALMDTALTAARKEIERHRLNSLGEALKRIEWIEPEVPRLSPRDLSKGRDAVEAAYRNALARLNPPS
jgi:NTE family protein